MLIVLVGGIMSGCGNKGNDFAIDRVGIYLTQAAKDSGKEYTIADFPEIELLKIEPWSDSVTNRSFSLYLKKPSKKNVLKAVELLNKRDDIELAFTTGSAHAS